MLVGVEGSNCCWLSHQDKGAPAAALQDIGGDNVVPITSANAAEHDLFNFGEPYGARNTDLLIHITEHGSQSQLAICLMLWNVLWNVLNTKHCQPNWHKTGPHGSIYHRHVPFHINIGGKAETYDPEQVANNQHKSSDINMLYGKYNSAAWLLVIWLGFMVWLQDLDTLHMKWKGVGW